MSARFEFHTPGLGLLRKTIAAAATFQTGGDPIEFARQKWGADSYAVQKAAVPGGGSTSGEWAAELAAERGPQYEFISAVRRQSVIKPGAGFREVPPNQPVCIQTDGATSYWSAQGKATPVSKAAFDRTAVPTLRVAALLVVSNDLLQSNDPRAERIILDDAVRAVAHGTDEAFLSPSNSGIAGEMPASITNGATTIASTGSLPNDVENAIESFSGDLLTAAWYMHPRLAAQAGLRWGGSIANDLGATGGRLAGLPVTVSSSIPFDSDGSPLILVDRAGIVVTEEGIELSRSATATIEQLDNPAGDSLTPTAATSLVSMFQTDSTALLAVRYINWLVGRPGSVVVIQGAAYATAN